MTLTQRPFLTLGILPAAAPGNVNRFHFPIRESCLSRLPTKRSSLKPECLFLYLITGSYRKGSSVFKPLPGLSHRPFFTAHVALFKETQEERQAPPTFWFCHSRQLENEVPKLPSSPESKGRVTCAHIQRRRVSHAALHTTLRYLPGDGIRIMNFNSER